MVNGLTRFKENFQGFENQYVIIGGTACDLIMEHEELPFRATKDMKSLEIRGTNKEKMIDILRQCYGLTDITYIDGYTRDRDGNIELDFPVYSKGFMPCGPIKKNEGNINTAIMCAGVQVEPGDLVVGDSDGVCVIPKKYVEVVLTEAETKRAYEKNRRETIAAYKEAKKNGTELPNLAPQWVLDMMNNK